MTVATRLEQKEAAAFPVHGDHASFFEASQRGNVGVACIAYSSFSKSLMGSEGMFWFNKTTSRVCKSLTLSAALVAATACVSTASAAPELEFIGEVDFPTGYAFKGTTVGGLSGIDYDRRHKVFYAISDDRSQINPARFYKLKIDLSDGMLDDGDVTFSDVTPMLDESGQPFAINTVDPESIRYDRARNALFWTSEGDANALLPPFVREMKLDGTFVRELRTPQTYTPTADQSSGIRNNLAFESLTFSPQLDRVITATENALYQDGPAASFAEGTPSRILEFAVRSGAPLHEYVYVTDPVADAPDPATAFATNGLVDFVTLGERRLLTMERSFTTDKGNVIKLFIVKLWPATDVRGFDSIEGHAVRPVGKTLVANLADFGIVADNVEGITFGPLLPDGKRSLILVSDNNFSTTQVTQFLAFRVKTGF
ncbi:MAG: esterase-like activity of phytase family protein [Rhodospirillales bacterium]|nr:esterase-like activity of phytase family protein [Rhodospirillales bacterium]